MRRVREPNDWLSYGEPKLSTDKQIPTTRPTDRHPGQAKREPGSQKIIRFNLLRYRIRLRLSVLTARRVRQILLDCFATELSGKLSPCLRLVSQNRTQHPMAFAGGTFSQQTGGKVSHGICPECAEKVTRQRPKGAATDRRRSRGGCRPVTSPWQRRPATPFQCPG